MVSGKCEKCIWGEYLWEVWDYTGYVVISMICVETYFYSSSRIDLLLRKFSKGNGAGRNSGFTSNSEVQWWGVSQTPSKSRIHGWKNGIPLHLWLQKVFQEIWEICGGWMAIEEEIELKNHLKWARILVSIDDRSLLAEVSITRNGITFYIPIWPRAKQYLKSHQYLPMVLPEKRKPT